MEPGQSRHRERNAAHNDGPRQCFMVVSGAAEVVSTAPLFLVLETEGAREQSRDRRGGGGAKLPEISVKNLSFPMDWTIGLVDSSPHPSTRFDRLVTYATLPSPHTTLSTPFRLPQPVWKNTGSAGEREPCRAATSAVRASDTRQQHPLAPVDTCYLARVPHPAMPQQAEQQQQRRQQTQQHSRRRRRRIGGIEAGLGQLLPVAAVALCSMTNAFVPQPSSWRRAAVGPSPPTLGSTTTSSSSALPHPNAQRGAAARASRMVLGESPSAACRRALQRAWQASSEEATTHEYLEVRERESA